MKGDALGRVESRFIRTGLGYAFPSLSLDEAIRDSNSKRTAKFAVTLHTKEL
jgi:hypothetical protein